MAFKLPQLPYSKGALAPHLSEETLEYHHGKHHATYVNTLNELIAQTRFADKGLEEIVKTADPGPIFNNAAQHWNHSFYWNCLKPKGGGPPKGTVADAINREFGDFEQFKKQFDAAAISLFGSGWVWLVRSEDGSLAVEKTADADNPLTHNQHALLTCDVWEHAYYIDYRNARGNYVHAFWNLVNWDFVASNLK